MHHWVECHDCGLQQSLPDPIPGHGRHCHRCRASFGRGVLKTESALALIATALLKLVGLGWLLLSTRRGRRVGLTDRTRLYRFIELVSRWSAVDIFVSALLTALVTLGNIATIEPGLGVLAFGAVVFVTMLATENFDPRLMWDLAGADHAP